MKEKLIHRAWGWIAAACLVGCSTLAVADTNQVGKAVNDPCKSDVGKMSVEGLPELTNDVIRTWIESGDATIQQKMYAAVCNVLREGDVHYAEDVTNYTLTATIDSDSLFHHFDMTVVVGKDRVRCYHALPILVHALWRDEAAKLIAQLNSSCTCGSFEMECAGTGKVSFRHTLPYEAIKYGGSKRIAELLLCGWVTNKTHDKLLLSVCSGALTFEQALEEFVMGKRQSEQTEETIEDSEESLKGAEDEGE